MTLEQEIPKSPENGQNPIREEGETSSESLKKHPSTKKPRYRPGTKALKEIRMLQKNTSLLIPKASFCRMVKDIIQSRVISKDFRIQPMALMALQEAAEAYIVGLLEMSNQWQ